VKADKTENFQQRAIIKSILMLLPANKKSFEKNCLLCKRFGEISFGSDGCREKILKRFKINLKKYF
jgi:hypothetical protein